MSAVLRCGWCDAKATRSVKYEDLVFPICDDPECKTELDAFMSTSRFMLTMDIGGGMSDATQARRINKLREYVRMQQRR